MRKTVFMLVLTIAAATTGGSAAGVQRAPSRAAAHVDQDGARIELPRGISLRVPSGWRVVRGWLSDVTDPAPVLAVASFHVRLSRHTCECGSPNVVGFPRRGAFLFMWEYLHFPRRSLARIPRRPRRFRIPSSGALRYTCAGPSDGFAFRDGPRVFQVEIYLGAGAGFARRAQLRDVMDSMRFAGA